MKLNHLAVVLSITLLQTQVYSDDYQSQMLYSHTTTSSAAAARAAALGVGVGQGGAGGAGGAANGGSASLTYVEAASPQQPSTVRIKNTPDLGSLNIPATAPCVVGYGAGVVAPGIGVNFGGAYTDDDCGSRETARSFVGMGDIQSAVEVLCASKYAAVAKVCKNLKAEESR